MYYLRSNAATDAIKFTVTREQQQEPNAVAIKAQNEADMACSLDNTDECIACGSCVDSCPVNAIVEAGDIYKITEACTDCQACVDTCPVNAIVE